VRAGDLEGWLRQSAIAEESLPEGRGNRKEQCPGEQRWASVLPDGWGRGDNECAGESAAR